ncbi:hypothetical protein GCM10009641_39920 [Mycobacterium cookii]
MAQAARAGREARITTVKVPPYTVVSAVPDRHTCRSPSLRRRHRRARKLF